MVLKASPRRLSGPGWESVAVALDSGQRRPQASPRRPESSPWRPNRRLERFWTPSTGRAGKNGGRAGNLLWREGKEEIEGIGGKLGARAR